jgi:chromosome segregation ATPase
MNKPTGEANRSEILELAFQINEQIRAKSGTSLLLDEDTSEEEHEAEGKGEPGVANTRKVIHLASDEDSDGEDEVKTSTKGKAAKSTFVVKGYQAANPLETKTRKARASTSQAADTISAVGHYFSPEHMRECEEAWANTSLNMFQLQSAQTELREARSRNEQLSDTLNTERRRADKLDNQNNTLKEKVEELKAAVDKTDSQNTVLKEKADELKAAADKMDNQNTLLKQKVEELNAEVQELKDNIRFMKHTRHRQHLDSDSESDNPRERRRR